MGKDQTNGSSSPKTSLISLLFHVALPTLAVFGALRVPLQRNTVLLSVIYYLALGFSYTAGYHRLFAHRSYKATRLLHFLFVFLGAGNFLGPVIDWCRDHRAHHRHADSERDPFNRSRGFWYSYMGCRLCDLRQVGEADVNDLTNDWLLRIQQKAYPLFAVIFGWITPALIASIWDDPLGGLVYAGLWRTLVFLQLHYLVWALGHTFGHQPYSDNHTGMNNTWLSILSLGEGYLNFHREFPSDYRMGCFYYHVDATKWFLRLLAVLGLAYDFKKTPYKQILLVRIQQQEVELDRLRAEIDFGPKVEDLPHWTKEKFDQEIANGRPLIIMDSIVHDLDGFFDKHPGGPEVLQPKLGKDATIAFNGGVQRHSKAARNLAIFMRIAYVDGATDLRKDVRAKAALGKSVPVIAKPHTH